MTDLQFHCILTRCFCGNAPPVGGEISVLGENSMRVDGRASRLRTPTITYPGQTKHKKSLMIGQFESDNLNHTNAFVPNSGKYKFIGDEMNRLDQLHRRRGFLGILGAACSVGAGGLLLKGCGGADAADAFPATLPSTTTPTAPEAPLIVMDGHVHITNRIYWEGIDPWQPNVPGGGWDFYRAKSSGVNCIIENLAPYGFWNYNYTPKQTLRLIDKLLGYTEKNQDKMGIAVDEASARAIIASGRVAVFIGCESGFDHEGDQDVLDAFYRLGLRSVQFATQTSFNAFADSGNTVYYGGLSDKGRKLVTKMNDLGILIDLTHGSVATQKQLVESSRAPVVASHEVIKSVSGSSGMADDLIIEIARKGGLVGIHGAGISKRYQKWQADHPAIAAAQSAPSGAMLGFKPSIPREPADHGEYIDRFDTEFRQRWQALNGFTEDPSAADFLPLVSEWVEHVKYVVGLVGEDHVAIGLDMVPGRTGVIDASGYGNLLAGLGTILSPEGVRKVAGENYMRVFKAVQDARA